MKCSTCKQEYSPKCDFNQGRCPHHPPMFNIQSKDTSKGHFYVSMIKSAVRIAAGVALGYSNFALAGALIVSAEVLGIVEELV